MPPPRWAARRAPMLLLLLLSLLFQSVSTEAVKGKAGAAASEAEDDPYDAQPVRNEVQEAIQADKLIHAKKLLKTELAALRRESEVLGRRKGAEPGAQPQFYWLGKSAASGAADLLGDLGNVYQRLGRQAEALAVLEEAADMLKTLFSERSPRYGMAADRLADALVQNGDDAAAVPLYRQVLANLRKTLGESSPAYALTLSKLANAASSAGKSKTAAKTYGEMLDLMGDDAPGGAGGGAAAGGGGGGGSPGADGEDPVAASASVRVRYARSLAGAGKYADALKEAERARDEFAASSAANSLEHAASINGVAGTLEKLGRYDEAISTMAAAYEMGKRAPGADPRLVEQAKRNLNGLRAHVDRKRREAANRDEL